MSWNYNTYSIDTISDLLSAIKTFSVNICGWTLNKESSDELYLSSLGESGTETLFYSFKSGVISGVNVYLRCCPSTSFNSSLAWNAQPGFCNYSGTYYATEAVLISPSMGEAYLFGNKDIIYCVIKIGSSYCQHLHFGLVNKLTASDSYGMFSCGSFSSAFSDVSNQRRYNTTYCNPFGSGVSEYWGQGMCCNISNSWYVANASGYIYNFMTSFGLNFTFPYTTTSHFYDLNYNYLVLSSTGSPVAYFCKLKNDINNKSILLPIIIKNFKTTNTPTQRITEGYLKNCFFTGIKGDSIIGEEIQYGAKIFKKFPLHKFNLGTSVLDDVGIAIRKV